MDVYNEVFLAKTGKNVEIWKVYDGFTLISFSYSIYPYNNFETIELHLSRI